MAKHWFLGAMFHNGSLICVLRKKWQLWNDEEERLGYEFQLDSWQANYNPVVRSYRTLGLSVDSC